MPAEQTRACLRRELGVGDLEEVFDWIDLEEPLGSASIAQAGPLSSCRESRRRPPLSGVADTCPCAGVGSAHSECSCLRCTLSTPVASSVSPRLRVGAQGAAAAVQQ